MRSPGNRLGAFPYVVAKIALSLLAVAMIYNKGVFGAAWRQLSEFDPGLVLLAVVLGVVQVSLGAVRWRNILALLGARVALREVLPLFYISVFFNTYVWGGVSGDVLRGWLTYRAGIDPAGAIHSVILDRIAAIAAVALLMLVTMPWLALRVDHGATLLALAALGGGILAAIALLSRFDRLPARWRGFRPARLLQDMGAATRQTLASPGAMPVMAAAILSQMALSLVTYTLAQALGIAVGLLDCLALMQPVALLIAMPISIGGWGVREAGMIGLLGLVDITAPKALLLSVALGLVAQAVALPGGVVWLFWRGANARPARS